MVFSSMRLGVPFIAPRQLGAVESNPGRQFLPSVAWRTGQSGADFLPYLAKPTVGSLGAVGAPDTVRCTPNSPVPPPDRWLGHVSRADCAADCWPGRPLAHRTVRCTPDSPVNFSRSRRRKNPRAAGLLYGGLAHRTLSGAHRTVRCPSPKQPSTPLLLPVSNT